MAEGELKKIKKIYGENFMKMCRSLFPTILEEEGKLYQILTDKFARNCQTLYEDIENKVGEGEFQHYIYSVFNAERKSENDIDENDIAQDKTPYELLDEAGYTLYECKTEEEIESFKKYYEPGEKLCTFGSNRLKKCVVFFAVRKDVENIKREDFDKPTREDEYGTSVMGIQFNKEGLCTVSIKNRYNHTVDNPDATYRNDLNRIANGLEQSFTTLLQERGLEFDDSDKEEFSMPYYVLAKDGKQYKCNMDCNGLLYCPGNIIMNYEAEEVHQFGKNEELIDYFIVDSQNKTIRLFDENISDSFVDGFNDIDIDKIEITKDKETGNGARTITVHVKDEEVPITISIDKLNQITRYSNPYLKEIGDDFLCANNALKQIDLPLLEQIGNDFLTCNKTLEKINMPNLRQAGKSFLRDNENLEEVDLPSLEQLGNNCLSENEKLEKIDMPSLKQVGKEFLRRNRGLKEIDLPSLEQVGDDCLRHNEAIETVNMPALRQVGDYFMYYNKELKALDMPLLKQVGNGFLSENKELETLNMPSLERVGTAFLFNNEKLKELEMQSLKRIGHNFLYKNKVLEKLELPLLENVNTLEKNQKEMLNKNIQPKETFNKVDIAKLDKKTKLTTSELKEAEQMLTVPIREQELDDERDER